MTRTEKLALLHETMKSLRYGVELETVGLSRTAIASAVAATTGGTAFYVGGSYDKWEIRLADGRKWSVVRDGSLSMFDSGEVVTPIMTWADMEVLQNVIRALREGGARVDDSCGVHIHVDGARFLEAPKSVRALVRLIYSREEFVEAALGIRGSMRRDRYAAGISQRIAEGMHRAHDPRSLARLWYGSRSAAPNPTPGRSDHYDRNPARDHYHGSRYHGVNLHSLFYRGTIEFRWFNGSLHAGEVKSYVHLVLAFAARALNRQAVCKRQVFDESQAHRGVRRMLRKLGLVGPEFKSTRENLLKRLPKSGPRPARTPVYGPVQQHARRSRAATRLAREHHAVDARREARTDAEVAQVIRVEQASPEAVFAQTASELRQGFTRPNGHLSGCSCIDCGAAYMAFMVERTGEVARG